MNRSKLPTLASRSRLIRRVKIANALVAVVFGVVLQSMNFPATSAAELSSLRDTIALDGNWEILFDPDKGDGFGLNPVSVLIWKLLDGKHDEGAIVAEIRRHYDEVPEDAVDHVQELIERLKERGLVGYEVVPE